MASIDERTYWDQRNATLKADMAAAAEAAAEAAKDPKVQLHRLWREHDAIPDVMTEQRAEIKARIHALDAAIKAAEASAFEAEWTLEVTKARRAAWNERAKAGEFGQPGRIDWKAYRAAEREQGWTLDNLKIAVKHHGL